MARRNQKLIARALDAQQVRDLRFPLQVATELPLSTFPRLSLTAPARQVPLVAPRARQPSQGARNEALHDRLPSPHHHQPAVSAPAISASLPLIPPSAWRPDVTCAAILTIFSDPRIMAERI